MAGKKRKDDLVKVNFVSKAKQSFSHLHPCVTEVF